MSPTSDEPLPDNSCIRSFRRSLKLLGLQLEGFDLNAAEPSPKPDIKNAKSKVNSLVTRRSVSLEDLHEAVITVGFPLANSENPKRHRKVLAKAVYEEWYFKKQEEEMKRKSEAKRQQKVHQWEIQHRRCEQIRKSKESYSEWLYKKKKQQQQEQLRKGPTKAIAAGPPPTPQQTCQQAYESWKREKEIIIKKKLEEARLRQKMLEDSTKREDSEKAYQEWKKKADKEWVLRIKNHERKLKELQHQEEKNKLDKKKHAELAYKGWLETKEEELKRKIKETRQAQAAAQRRMASRHSDRLYESQQAFLAWLDLVEERFCKELEKKKLQKQLAED